MSRHHVSYIVLPLSLLIGCGTADLRLELRGKNDLSAVNTVSQGLSASEVTYSEAKLVLASVEIESESEAACSDADGEADESEEGSGEQESEAGDDDCESESEAEFEGPFVADLLASSVDPELPAITIPAGAYSEAELDLDAATGLLGQDTSLLVRGEWAGPNGAVPFEVRSSLEESFEIEGATALDVSAGSSGALLVNFDLDAWFVNVDLTGAAVSDDGVIRIDAENNAALLGQIEANIEASAEIEHDDEEDDGEEEYGDESEDDDTADESAES